MENDKSWLVIRKWGKPSDEHEVCVLTTRHNILSRHPKEHIRLGLCDPELKVYEKVPGLRRYITEEAASKKANDLNEHFKTNGYSAVREDGV